MGNGVKHLNSIVICIHSLLKCRYKSFIYIYIPTRWHVHFYTLIVSIFVYCIIMFGLVLFSFYIFGFIHTVMSCPGKQFENPLSLNIQLDFFLGTHTCWLKLESSKKSYVGQISFFLFGRAGVQMAKAKQSLKFNLTEKIRKRCERGTYTDKDTLKWKKWLNRAKNQRDMN